jgi:hypothetical protein
MAKSKGLSPSLRVSPEVEEYLNEVISINLWEPGGDPTTAQLKSAAYAFLALEKLGLEVIGKKDVLSTLREVRFTANLLKKKRE